MMDAATAEYCDRDVLRWELEDVVSSMTYSEFRTRIRKIG